MFRIFRNLIFLSWLAFALATTTIAASIWAATMTYKAAQLSTEVASTALRHRKEIARITSQSASRVKQITAQNARKISEMAATHKAQVAKLTARHRTAVRKALLRAKAKARLRRIIVAVPFLGLAAVTYFEDQDRIEWLEENPDKTSSDYACEVYEESKDLVADMQREANDLLEQAYKKLPYWVPSWFRIKVPDLMDELPTCSLPALPE